MTSPQTHIRGRKWFHALTAHATQLPSDPASVLTADAPLGDLQARFLCVVPNPEARFPCARHGEVGLEEAYTLATRIHEVIHSDPAHTRPIVAIVNVKSQAYGRREESAAIFLAAATAAEAYASARMAGHPVIALVVGHAFSGGFLTHGFQANRILAFDDPEVIIHAMHREAAARITRRTVEELDELGQSIAPLSYNIRDFATLGLLHQLLEVPNPDEPNPASTRYVQQQLLAAIADARNSPADLSSRWLSPSALESRKASNLTRKMLARQWQEIEGTI
jgi:malonate decarboxylase gamma subunit